MNTRGGMLVSFQTSWAGSDVLQPGGTGRRLRIDYEAPLNGVIFWVTSPHTCHHGSTCPTEPQDPVISLIFTVDIVVTCTSQAPGVAQTTVQTIPLPISCASDSSITPDAVLGGDVTGQLDAAALGWVKQLTTEAGSVVATGGASLPAAAAAAIAGAVNVAVKGIGAAVAAISDQHLRDFVSSSLSILASHTAGTSANQAGTAFASFFQELYGAQLNGLKPFAVEIGQGASLNFGLGYPPPAKPVLENTTKAQNQGSIISPAIAVAQQQVAAGQTIPVQATYFRGTYVNEMDIGWNKTVLGKPVSKLKWGPPEVTITTSALSFQATDLKPNTGYGFAVQECDALSCSPWSEVLAQKTEGAAAGDVVFWLDSNLKQPVGMEALAAGGGAFTAKVTIPVTTAPGQHMLNAAAPGQPVATAPIEVCAASGCGASVALVNTANNTFYPPGWRVEVSYPVTLRGSQFPPGGVATIYLDSVNGAKLGTAPVGPLGHFQLTLSVPRVAQGAHNFIAVEGGQQKFVPVPGHPLQNAMAKQAAGKTVEASVSVEVQAMAQ